MTVLAGTNLGINNVILPPDKKESLLGISCVGDLVIPQGIGGPVKVTLEDVGDTEFGTDEVPHKELHALYRGG
jgi:hypothetical protein